MNEKLEGLVKKYKKYIEPNIDLLEKARKFKELLNELEDVELEDVK